MKFELEHNTQEAVQFVLLAAAIVLGLRLLIGGADLLIGSEGSELDALLSHQRNGFLVPKGTIAYSSMDVVGRLAVASLIALGGSVLAGTIIGVVSRSVNGSFIKTSVITIRFAVIILLAVSMYSALFLPEKEIHFAENIAVEERRTLLGSAVPFTSTRTIIGPENIGSIVSDGRSIRIIGTDGGTITSIPFEDRNDELVDALQRRYIR